MRRLSMLQLKRSRKCRGDCSCRWNLMRCRRTGRKRQRRLRHALRRDLPVEWMNIADRMRRQKANRQAEKQRRDKVEKVTSKDGTIITYDRMGQGPAVVLVCGGSVDRQSNMSLAEAL